MNATTSRRYDVVIVGGAAAGLSGALMLGRARRHVLVIDNGQPRNAPAAHMHGFPTLDGSPPDHLLETTRREAAGYGVEFTSGAATSASRTPAGFAVELDSGDTVHARKLLVATGVTDELPEIPGLAQRWGRDVLHCPYCHGWEFRDQPIGVLATGAMSVHQVLLFRQWTDQLTLLRHTGPAPSDDELERLTARGISVVGGEVTSVEVADDRLAGIRLDTGEVISLRALVLAPRSVPRADVLTALGVEPVAHPSGLGEHIAADPKGATAVPGVWVAGNLADLSANVLASAAAGSLAGAAINADLVGDDTEQAVRTRQDPFSATAESRNCELVMGDRRHGI